MTRDHYGALFFLAVSAGYLALALNIELWPGAEAAPFTPRTMPLGIGVAGVVVSLLLLLRSPRAGSEGAAKGVRETLRGLRWRRVVILALLMVGYGLAIKSLGFILSTAVFLFGGFCAMGERRWLPMGLVALAVTLGFWAVLSLLLGIYLDPGVFRFLG